MLKDIKTIPLWIYLILIGFITFYTTEIKVASDMIWYMNSALNMSLDKGYMSMDGSLILDRGPLFPYLISLSYKLLDITPWSAYWVVRLFCILNPLIVYFLGSRLFGKWVGFVSSIFILSSYSVGFWSYRHVDAVWPFFVILGSYCVFIGFENRKRKYSVLSGICLGLAFLTSEISLVFISIPVLMFLCIEEYRQKDLISALIINVLITILVVSPWLYYLWQHDSLRLLLGLGGPKVASQIFNPSDFSKPVGSINVFNYVWAVILTCGKGLLKYYQGGKYSLANNIIIAPLFILGWIFIITQVFRNDKSAKILISICAAFLPILIHLGNNDSRLGISVFFLLLSYMSLAVFIFWLGGKIVELKILAFNRRSWIILPIILVIVVLQIIGDGKGDAGYRTIFQQSFLGRVLTGESTNRRIQGLFEFRDFKKTIERLKKKSRSGEPILVDWYYGAMTAYFMMRGNNIIFSMPFVTCTEKGVVWGQLPKNREEKPIYIESNNLAFTPRFAADVLFESNLLGLIEKEDIQFILITYRHAVLHKYFSSSPCFEELMRFGGDSRRGDVYRVYRVIEKEDCKKTVLPLVGYMLRKVISSMKQQDPNAYEHFRKKYMQELVLLTPGEAARIFDSVE
jgi:hypothetical protein